MSAAATFCRRPARLPRACEFGLGGGVGAGVCGYGKGINNTFSLPHSANILAICFDQTPSARPSANVVKMKLKAICDASGGFDPNNFEGMAHHSTLPRPRAE